MFLKVSQVDVRYAGQSRSAVQGVSLQLQAGQIGVLIGPSGCGKTSLLRAVAGLEDLHAGQVELSNRVVSRQGFTEAPEKRRMGMVFQDYALFPHLTVAENIAFGLQNLQKSSQTQRIQEVLDLVGLTEVKIEYSRPAMRGRTIMGDLVPFGSIWRTGANKNTTITFSDPVIVGGQALAAGTYALFSRPGENLWELFLFIQPPFLPNLYGAFDIFSYDHV